MSSNLHQAFFTPSSEFSPIPFWFWNDQLSENEITRQIEDFAFKGVMGFVIHPRKGLPKDIPYLSDTFMYYVKHAVKEAAKLGMRVVLYDEAMYPSGSAHGLVVKSNPEYATRALRLEELPIAENIKSLTCLEEISRSYILENEQLVAIVAARRNSQGDVIRESLQELRDTGLSGPFDPDNSPTVLFFLIESYSNGHIRGVHLGEDDGEADAPPSGDLLNPDAMRKFIQITHDRYYEVLKDYFGSTVIAMFTDEPDVLGRGFKEGIKPWSVGFADHWTQFGGKLSDLPLLWCSADDGTHEAVRTQYQKAIYSRLSDSYYRQISQWCQQHGIALTGHPAKSDDIGLLKHFHIPGQDVVWRWVAPEEEKGITGSDSTMGKCSSDAARHRGKRRNANECFGCCGPAGVHWAFTCDDMKWYLDWLFVRGVNLLYPHAFFYSVQGEERFGERPPDVGPNNTFWPHYKRFSDYIKRMCWLMTDSYNTTPIAILCREDHLPWEPAKELFRNQLEFNYLEDTVLADSDCRQEKGWLTVHKQAYRIVLVDSHTALPPEAARKLDDFSASGGHVLYWDRHKHLVNALRSIFADDSTCPPQITISGVSSQNLRVSHVVKDGQDFYLLTNEGEEEFSGTALLPHPGMSAQLWDAWNGTIDNVCTHTLSDGLSVALHLGRRESIILFIDHAIPAEVPEKTASTTLHTLADLRCGTWTVTAGNLVFDTITLMDWTNWPGMEDFSGSVVYEASFENTGEFAGDFVLDLENVREIASVTVNCQPVGTRFWAPYWFDISEFLREGTNSIRIEVTNTPANRIMKAKLPSGIIQD